ncbi:metallophosphoesterase family protein [Solicola gregarius]|uniref:Metallophosphatase family protein n=1 Tax=Solicola gregarius TaxID=2908642 RepID=A0AA46YK63_9ACTN|nr:metallophosphoesterase family protein [Solicola gregarius]UYM04166.1 metallophosphatase family protein [Solicola gregarius]
MNDTVAVLSDIHGVLPVLDAVLAEPAVAAAGRLVVTGDHAAGPQPVEVLDRLASLGDRVTLVRGNGDRDLVTYARGGDAGINDPIARWAAEQLERRHVDLLDALPHPVVQHVDGFGEVLFCHGTPRDDNEVVLVDTRMARWEEAFGDLPADVRTVVCGHTHMPFVRLVDRRMVVNPGSIGMPYGSVGGHWALLDHGAVTLHRTPIDVDAVCDRIVAESTYPDRRAWVDEYVRGSNSDADAIAAFGPRDGR